MPRASVVVVSNSSIRVAVGDCSVTKCRGGVRFIKLHMRAKTNTTNNDDGRTAPSVSGYGSVPLSLLGNAVTRIGLQLVITDGALPDLSLHFSANRYYYNSHHMTSLLFSGLHRVIQII